MRIYPDKPVRTSPVVLDGYDQDKYMALAKLDGWRCLIEIGETINDVAFTSRTGKPLPVGDKIKKFVQHMIENDKLPINCTIDGEWMKRRPDYIGPECIYIWSPLVLAGEWVGHLDFKTRWDWVNSLGLPSDDISVVDNKLPDYDLVLPASSDNFLGLFEATRNAMRTEGIVLYPWNYKVKGSPQGCQKNRSFMKCKWRDGDSGRTIVC